MELTELHELWTNYDKKLSENTRLNREILRLILLSKPQKRVTWIKLKAGFNLIIPIIGILFIMVPETEFRNEISFYAGLFLFCPFAIITYYWAIRYYLLIDKIDFTSSVTDIRKNIKLVEIYKIKMTKFGYLLAPFGITGVFLIADIPLYSKDSFIPVTLILMVFVASIFYTYKFSITDRFHKLNSEINELEQLEK
jgi:hypothetical protein